MTSAQEFLALHHTGEILVIPNVWDAGSARIMRQVGFPVLATTSAGIAFSRGLPDGVLSRAQMLDRVAEIVEAVDCPVSADLEAGYGPEPSDVADTITAALAVGVVGANIEDSRPDRPGLYGAAQAAERIQAARAAGSFVLNARVDTYLAGVPDAFAQTVSRAERYVEAGADCVYVPGVDDPATIGSLVTHIGAPLNVVAGLTSAPLGVAGLQRLGVARVSIGGSLARAVLAQIEQAGRDLLQHGTFAFAERALPHADLQNRFRNP